MNPRIADSRVVRRVTRPNKSNLGKKQGLGFNVVFTREHEPQSKGNKGLIWVLV